MHLIPVAATLGTDTVRIEGFPGDLVTPGVSILSWGADRQTRTPGAWTACRNRFRHARRRAEGSDAVETGSGRAAERDRSQRGEHSDWQGEHVLSDRSRPVIEATLPVVADHIEEIASRFYTH